MLMSNEYYLQIEEEHNEKPRILLPSEREKPRKNKDKKNKGTVKWGLIIGFIILIYLFYEPFLSFIMDILKSNPTIYRQYVSIESEIINNTLKGLFFVSILGSIFFLTLPSEALFIYYLNSTEYNFILLISLMILGNLTGLAFNYFFGRILGERVLEIMFKKNFENYKNKIEKYGGVVLFIGNIFPGPIEVLAVFYGGFKFGFQRYIYLCFMGRLIKYTVLLILFIFFWDQIVYFYEGILENFLIVKDVILS